MAKTDFKSVDAYIATQPEATQSLLKRVRSIIRAAIPTAEETISYQIPAYKLPGGAVIYFAGWKQHYSIYPATDAVVAALGPELARFKVSRGTIRFPLTEPIPEQLIEAIARLRAKEVHERAAKVAKAPARTKRQRSDGLKP